MTRIISIVGGLQPSTPTIGTATAGDTTASVAFTASTYIGKGTITYTATSSPGGLTGTASSSPITVTGLTNGTAYTFTVTGTTNYGVTSIASGSSNSITPALGDLGAMFPISSVVVNATSVTSVTFSSIPQTYTHLQLRTSYVGTGTFSQVRFNGDSGSNYSFHQLWGDGATAQAGGGASSSLIYLNNSSTNPSYPSVGIMDLLDYTNTNKYKTVRSLAGYDINGGGELYYRSGAWRNTASVTSLVLTSSATNGFTQYTSFTLYGIKGA
jgi:hypothetical protein